MAKSDGMLKVAKLLFTVSPILAMTVAHFLHASKQACAH